MQSVPAKGQSRSAQQIEFATTSGPHSTEFRGLSLLGMLHVQLGGEYVEVDTEHAVEVAPDPLPMFPHALSPQCCLKHAASAADAVVCTRGKAIASQAVPPFRAHASRSDILPLQDSSPQHASTAL